MVELGPLMLFECVFDGELVQSEFARQFVELILGRSTEIDPDDRVGVSEVVGYLCEREVLGLEDTLAIHACQALSHRCQSVFGRLTKRRAVGEKNHPAPALVPPSTGMLCPVT